MNKFKHYLKLAMRFGIKLCLLPFAMIVFAYSYMKLPLVKKPVVNDTYTDYLTKVQPQEDDKWH